MHRQTADSKEMRSLRRERQAVKRLLTCLGDAGAPAWLSGEHYLLSRSCRRVLGEMEGVRRLPFVRDPRGRRIPYAFSVSDAIEPGADTEGMTEALAHFHPDERFLRTFPMMRAAAVLCRLSESMDAAHAPAALPSWLDQLHRVMQIDWGAVHDRLSGVEEALVRDPSGAYPRCTDESRSAYRDALRSYAERRRMTEEDAAQALLQAAENAASHEDRDIAVQLFGYPGTRRGVIVHAVLFLLAAGMSFGIGLWLYRYGMWVAAVSACILYLPFYALCRELADTATARFGRKYGLPVLRYRLEKLPEEGKTLVVVTALLRGGVHDRALIGNLERFYLRCRDDNLCVGLLCDLPTASSEVTDGDAAVIDAVKEQIATLNRSYGGAFCLFVRKRTWNGGEGVFCGWERKRGAVLTLARYLRGVIGEDAFAAVLAPRIPLGELRYVCTLDEDTELPPGAAAEMVGVMLHPYNRPQIHAGAVRRGSAMVQPAMTVTLAGAAATRFTLLCTGKGGSDPYSRRSTDGESVLYGMGSFCGKGLFDVDAYLAVLDHAFPEEAVLSHDFLEGARLGCRNLPDVVFSDRIPTRVGAYFSRQSRWVRGDIQALRFAFFRHKNADGEVTDNPISHTARLRVIDHALYALIPAAVLRGALVLSFLPVPHGVTLLLWGFLFSSRLLRPFLLCLKPWAWRSLLRQFYGFVYTDLRQGMLWLWFRVQFAAHEGWINTKAIAAALYRMLFTKKHLLEWVTAGEAEAGADVHTFAAQLRTMRISLVLGAVLVLFSPHISSKVIGLIWLCAPWMAEHYSAPPQTRITRRQYPAFLSGNAAAKKNRGEDALVMPGAAELSDYARDIWSFFEEQVGEGTNHLPPDNVQWFPMTEEKRAMRTSPTNIGLYLVCCTAACDFGFLTPRQLADRLNAAIHTLLRMETFRGHYYNWYDLATLEVLGVPYLSTVDSGNLACALLCAAAGAQAYAGQEIRLTRCAKHLRRIAARMDFSFLYDARRGLLHLGYDVQQQKLSTSHYDLYCSEARSAVYYAAASGQIPHTAWDRLGRPVTVRNRQMGVLSWSGSAFEYFMPALWLPVPENSFSAEMLAFAAAAQADDACTVHSGKTTHTVFGTSEGAYFAFDREMNFQYQPCGVPSLAVCGGMERQRLCMPYALFLMLPFAGDALTPVFRDLRALGMYGKYGFYEALDLTKTRVGGGYAAVRSYMAHHMGMSLLALANAAFDGVIQRRFLEDPAMEAMRILLDERIPADAAASAARAVDAEEDVRRRMPSGETETADEQPLDASVKRMSVLSNTAASVIAASDGWMTLSYAAIALTPQEMDPTSLTPAVYCLDSATGKVYTPCMRMADPTEWVGVTFTFREEEGALVWCAAYPDGTECTLSVTVDASSASFAFSVSLVRHGKVLPFVLTFFFRPVLYAPYAYAAHTTFADLFLHTAVRGQTLTVRRRPRGEGERERVLHLHAGGLDSLHFVTDAGHLLPLGYSAQDCRALASRSVPGGKGNNGSALVPIVYLRGRAVSGEAAVLLQLGGGEPTWNPALLSSVRAELWMLCGGSPALQSRVSVLLEAICDSRKTRLFREPTASGDKENGGFGKERYWKYGISGDLPVIALLLDDTETAHSYAAETLSAWKYLLLCGIRCDLLLCVTETDAYGQPQSDWIREETERQGLRFFREAGAGGGTIHVCRYADAQAGGLLISAAAVLGGSRTEAVLPELPRMHQPVTRRGELSYTIDRRRIVIDKGRQQVPWSYLLTNGVFGTLLTVNTLGFSFFTNSRECRVTPWYGDPLSERSGELLLLRFGGESSWHDLCRESLSVIIMRDAVHYLGILGTLSYRVTVTLPDRMKHKRIELYLKNDGITPLPVRVRYQTEPLLGALPEDREAVSWAPDGDTVVFRSETNAACAHYRGVLSLSGAGSRTAGHAGALAVYVGGSVTLPVGDALRLYAHLRVIRDGERTVSPETLVPPRGLGHLPKIDTGSPQLDPLVNTWLPVQIVYVRMWGRCGYYQPGGAYGFRDQLQDAMAAALFDPALLRQQIFRAAAHQYVEGDVQHWWHPGPLPDPAKFHRGIRSRCSDDRLWLPLAVARYCALTGDRSVLARQVRYLESPPLTEEELERYEVPLRSDVKESLYMHCVRAIECSLKVGFGVHGLPFIGIGDWNDGMNRVGNRGQGESVWCGMFLLLVLSEFLPLCEEQGDCEGAASYAAVMKRLARAIEDEAWNGQWYRRAWYDDGTPMGNPGDREAEIDLLPQAFAAIVNQKVRLPDGSRPFDETRVRQAMLAAYERLFDAEREVFALLSPPFGAASADAEKPIPDPGYIAGYLPGARENGGQYTHAAVWGAMGLFAIGEEARAMRVLRALSPIRHTRNSAALKRYQKEPWALCGDVLMTPGREGEGGWSLYTGSAGWYYRLLYEVFGDRGTP